MNEEIKRMQDKLDQANDHIAKLEAEVKRLENDTWISLKSRIISEEQYRLESRITELESRIAAYESNARLILRHGLEEGFEYESQGEYKELFIDKNMPHVLMLLRGETTRTWGGL